MRHFARRLCWVRRRDGDGGGDGGDDSGRATATESGTPTPTPIGERPETPASNVTRWMPDPELLDQEYPISGVSKLGDLTMVSRFARSVSVLVGEFDRTEVEDGLRGYGFEAGESHNGFRLFSANNSRAAAVRDGVLVTVGSVSSTDSTDKLPVVERVVDARSGQANQYVDATADCSRLLDALGSVHVLQGRTHKTGETFEKGVGEGMRYHVGSEETRVHAAALFVEGDANRSAMSGWAGDSEAFLGGEPTVRTDGRTVTATTLVSTGDVTDFPGEFPGPEIESERVGPPTAGFAFEYSSSDGGPGTLQRSATSSAVGS